MMAAEQSQTAKEQSAFIGRMLSIPMLSLLLLGLWVVIASVLTPLSAPLLSLSSCSRCAGF